MSKTVEIKPITRIEGHGKAKFQLDEDGNVLDTKLSILQLRGFEKFLEGRQVEKIPRLSARICGICTEAHHTCASKATDDLFDVTPPIPAKKLRRILHLAGIAQSHILHFYFLALPDFLFPEESEGKNIARIAKKKPDLAKKAIGARKEMKKLVKDIGGKEINPVTFVPGGVSKSLSNEKREKHFEEMESILKFALDSVEICRDMLEKKKNLIDDLSGVDSYQMGTVKDGNLSMYEGNLRAADAESNVVSEFESSEYLDYIGEKVVDHSYTKSPYFKGEEVQDGFYRVNSLPRLNICNDIDTERAQELLEEFRNHYGKPLKPLVSDYARLIELVYTVEKIMQLLEDEKISDNDNLRSDVSLDKSSEGIGHVEAPRGVLIHHYKSNEKGIITDANLLVATVQNTPVIERDLHKAAKKLIKDGKVSDKTLNKLEMLIRSYDPCLSCATHTLGLGHPIKLEIVDNEGNIVAKRG